MPYSSSFLLYLSSSWLHCFVFVSLMFVSFVFFLLMLIFFFTFSFYFLSVLFLIFVWLFSSLKPLLLVYLKIFTIFLSFEMHFLPSFSYFFFIFTLLTKRTWFSTFFRLVCPTLFFTPKSFIKFSKISQFSFQSIEIFVHCL